MNDLLCEDLIKYIIDYCPIETLFAFYALLVLYILLALFTILKCECLATLFKTYAEYLVPVLLIGLGVFILSDSIIWTIIF